jgi:hypothetical protein
LGNIGGKSTPGTMKSLLRERRTIEAMIRLSVGITTRARASATTAPNCSAMH